MPAAQNLPTWMMFSCVLLEDSLIAGSFNKVPAVFPFPEPIPHEVPRRHRGLTIEMWFLGFLAY